MLGTAPSLSARVMVEAARASVVGRVRESEVVAAALAAGRNLLLEGPPGTGKTTMLRALAAGAGVGLVLVEGNADLTPARLVGHHDPSRVLTEDYRPDNFVPGPLCRAMTDGALLYVEELNRVPEETLNVLLGVLSEREVHIPRYGVVRAAPSFRLVAAMNPYDAVGTARITPALYDRSCRVSLGYQDEDVEQAVVARVTGGAPGLVARAVRAVRLTRTHADLRIGASVRGAIDTVLVAAELATLRAPDPGTPIAADPSGTTASARDSDIIRDDVAGGVRLVAPEASATGPEDGPVEPLDPMAAGLDAARAALSGKVTVQEGCPRTVDSIIEEIWERAAPGKP